MSLSIITCSPHFVSLAVNELTRHCSSITVLAELAPGCWLIHSPASFNHVTAPWQQKLPIYLHHACPVDGSYYLSGTSADLTTLRQLIEHHYHQIPDRLQLTKQDPSKTPFIVQPRILAPPTRQPDYTVQMLTEILNPTNEAFFNQEPTQQQILSLLIVPYKAGWQVYFGLSWSQQNLSPWPNGVYPYWPKQPNRAGYKLLEALMTFDIQLKEGQHALDLGAAPGAWTQILRQHGLQLVTVSPGWLYAHLHQDPLITHFHMKAESYLQQVSGLFDVIVNDMKMMGQDSARLMVAYAAHLQPHGVALMTLKLRKRNRLQVMDHTLRILRKAYRIVRIRQLVSNRNEVTLFLRKRCHG